MEIKPVNNNTQLIPTENRVKCALCQRLALPGNRYCRVCDQSIKRDAERYKLASDWTSYLFYYRDLPEIMMRRQKL